MVISTATWLFGAILSSTWAARPEVEHAILQQLSAAEMLRSMAVIGSSDIEDLSTQGEKKACTGRIPMVGRRLCLTIAAQFNYDAIARKASDAIFGNRTQDSTTFIHQQETSTIDSMNALGAATQMLPDLLVELAWMGCPKCEGFKACFTDNPATCQEGSDGIRYMWSSLMVLSLKSLVGGSCWTLTDLVLVPALAATGPMAAAGYLATYMQAAGKMLPWVLSKAGAFAGKKILADTLGKYCLYLANHKKTEPEYTEDVTCIDHLYSFKAPALLGLVSKASFTCPGRSLICWPVKGVGGDGSFVMAAAAADSAAEEEEVTKSLTEAESLMPLDLLKHNEMCAAQGERECSACKQVMQMIGWRINKFANNVAAMKDLGELTGKMLIHQNKGGACVHLKDKEQIKSCDLDYSLCIVDDPTAKECSAKTSMNPDGEIFCTALCQTSCTESNRMGYSSFCYVAADMLGLSCKNGETLETVQAGRLYSWVNCDPTYAMENSGRKMIAAWNPTAAKTAAVGMPDSTGTKQQKIEVARELLDKLSQDTSAKKSLAEIAQLHLSQLMADNKSFQDARNSFCVDAGCC